MSKSPELLNAEAEIERLKEEVASLRASSGYEASIAQLEIERLRAALRYCGEMAHAPIVVARTVRRALGGRVEDGSA